jgi:hypothetical protein
LITNMQPAGMCGAHTYYSLRAQYQCGNH